ncbi:MAG: glutamine--fructose-6-phosphate transaminase (isomerizing), partial [Thermoplasmata archaeon]|nr:glutamine--fructose-6-phosphate transaminase (isomerizing) [Thermoplasmata archaeon]
RLEYRGYDSAGLALIEDHEIKIAKKRGHIADLEKDLPDFKGRAGIGHTRWATHGKPTDANAHPFSDCGKKFALVHNGIIENYMDLKEDLVKEGHEFTSDTDTEVLVHLVEKYSDGDFESAVKKMLSVIKGSYAFVVLSAEGEIIAARKESPLIVGIGNDENYVASDVPALLKETNKVIYLRNGEYAVVTPHDVRVMGFDGSEVEKEVTTITWDVKDAEKSGFEHFMLKEIFETPTAVHNTILGRISDMDQFGKFTFDSIKLVACGTSYHAALVGKYVFEDLAMIPASCEMSSEYRYSSPSMERPLSILISQSGETADTLAAATEAKRRGCRTLAISNYMGSTLTREVDEVLYTRAGLEIGVAATKTFTTQLVAIYLLAVKLGMMKHTLEHGRAGKFREDIRFMPRWVENVLDTAPRIREIARSIAGSRDMFFIGRNINYPVALEGALKMKEISYIHAEGYPSGELKHGPLALITKETPVIAIAIRDHTYEKVLGNVGEVAARDSPVIGVGYEDDRDLKKYVDEVLYVPRVPNIFSPVPISVALQLLAYYVAK